MDDREGHGEQGDGSAVGHARGPRERSRLQLGLKYAVAVTG